MGVSLSKTAVAENQLGALLKERRTRLDPAALGFPAGRRRTAGLRREEVAQRANISAAWYTWLEQGRGGAPSADVLDRIAGALMMTDDEREHLFLLGLGHPPEARYRRSEGGTPRLQRVLDRLEPSPALIRTAIWDVVAWNRAATRLLTDFGALPVDQRNILRSMFLDARFGRAQPDWPTVGRALVAAFRIDVARAGAAAVVQPLVDELRRSSEDFSRMWEDNEAVGPRGGIKHMHHPVFGALALEYSGFAVDGRPDLTMIVYNPLTPEDEQKLTGIADAPMSPVR